jgi:hypothetical protein
MATINTRQINGIIRTTEPVWTNLERLAEACVSWFTYDVHTGLYSWVINEIGNPIASLTEADIIGTIQISGSGLNNLYNSVEIEYPNTEIRDQPHYVRIDLPPGIRNEYEPDNTLQITSEFINNQPQAMYMADVNLRQSRLDRSVTIVMDYTKINLRAGDIIDLTSDTYAWVNKEFRIMRVREIEGDDGSLRLEFQLVEYDDSIYTGDISQFLVGGVPGIRGLGTIGKPGTPTVELTTLDSLPAQTVTTTVPAGVVDRMQFWAGNLDVTGNINSTTFDLYGTEASLDALSFTQGGNVVFTTTALRDGTWIWKTRGTNTNGAGPFSDPSGNVAYSRNQAADVIKAGTPIVTTSGTILSPVDNASWRSVGIPDILQFTGNSAFKGMIWSGDATMVAVNGSIGNVSYEIPVGSNSVAFDLQTTALVREVAANAVSTDMGLAQYIAYAPWDASEYTANGFSGLNWSDWNWISSQRDENGYLTSNGINIASISIGGTYTSIIDNTDPTHIIAFGYSSTINPASGDFTTVVDPISGITTAGYQVPVSGNTVFEDSTGNGSPVYQTPGITAGLTLGAAAASLFGKIRIDR